MKLIIENDKDQRIYDWLIGEVGEQAIFNACKQLAGKRRAYISNVVKILNLTVPGSVIETPKTKALENLAEIRKKLNKRG